MLIKIRWGIPHNQTQQPTQGFSIICASYSASFQNLKSGAINLEDSASINRAADAMLAKEMGKNASKCTSYLMFGLNATSAKASATTQKLSLFCIRKINRRCA